MFSAVLALRSHSISRTRFAWAEKPDSTQGQQRSSPIRSTRTRTSDASESAFR